MRFCFIIIFFLTVGKLPLYAQPGIVGRWLSVDEKRVYYIYHLNDSLYEAKLIYTKRAGEDTGTIVLKKVSYNTKRKRYEGLMYSVTDKYLVRLAKMKPSTDGNTLQFTLPRMLFMNVHLQWKRLK
jgi:hypothetical protein